MTRFSHLSSASFLCKACTKVEQGDKTQHYFILLDSCV
jgi:hypothetical protein